MHPCELVHDTTTGVFCIGVLYRQFSFLVSWVGTHIACEDINATQVSHAFSFIMELKIDCTDAIQLHQISDLFGCKIGIPC